MSEETKIEFCTSCGSKDIEVTGNKYYCNVCDVTYQVTTAGTEIVSTDPLKKQNERIDQIAADVEQLKGKKPVEQSPAELELKPTDEAAEEDQDGFITIED